MSKGLIVAVVVLLLFGAVTLFKLTAGSDDGAAQPTADSAPGRADVREFWARYRAATDARVSGRITEARDAYRAALALDPSHEDVLYYLGNVELELGHYGAAESAWRRLIEINPASARTHSRLGDLYACPDSAAPWDLARADAEFHRAAELNREETGPLLRLAEVAVLRNDLTGALTHLDAVIVTHPRSVEARYLKGYVAWKRGQKAEAAAELGEAMALANAPQTVQQAPAEGDTKHGATPLVLRAPHCQLFDNQITPYGSLDRRLQQIAALQQ